MPRPAQRLAVALLLCLVSFAQSQTAAKPSRLFPTPQEQRAIQAFEAAKKNPLELTAFLVNMPKGGDLHMHLSGAVYAETFIRQAVADELCYSPATRSLFKPSSAASSLPPQQICGEGNRRAEDALKDQKLYDALVDNFSMRSFVSSAGVSGHDQFFATFSRFGSIKQRHVYEWLDEVATRAAAQNEQYLEIMQTPDFSAAAKLGYSIPWPSTPADPAMNRTGDATGTTHADLAKLRDQLLAGGLRDIAAANLQELSDALDGRNRIENCGTPAATRACSVKIRFLYQVLRGFPPQQVFAQTLLGFEVVQAELDSGQPRIVGLNFVMPEDSYLSMSEYHRQMLMLDYLHSIYPRVHISLHAGELAPGLVPPDGLRFHIREAIDLGHAERIGHGVDIMYENEPQALLKEMASRHIMTEINLTSNDVILGVEKQWHPLPVYRAAGVPVALSTDDEGVSRINITHEYTRAALDFSLSYLDLKRMARTSLEHSFLPGASLWSQPDVFTAVNPACAAQPLGSENPTPKCLAFFRSSEKAAEQWQLEHRYQLFESSK
ncbi:adenosine deaminase family protein [Edaphobacter aggregans]|uniref:adenosine deaminase family protein n=1 Tax=Edaphobacter aggregans TaxID=570835 RepID=UPI000A045F37|nr:adenosine deaminase [Edaphobacter aggregans]